MYTSLDTLYIMCNGGKCTWLYCPMYTEVFWTLWTQQLVRRMFAVGLLEM